ncbi:unnamed protein product [Ilex paraguariensis]|uniref:FAR1 domain-containing protein n=1 Tax=Ilex paraguariensis TaxID=185542 RepID=A0ABC8URE2_9AQUA
MTNVVDVDEPKVGMIFESYKRLLEYYTGYGKRLGFPVKIRSSIKGEDDELKYVTIVCSRSGKSKSTSKYPLKSYPNIKACRSSESDVIGLVDGQSTSEAIDDSQITQMVNVGISDGQCSSLQFCNNNMALLWGVTQTGLGNHFMMLATISAANGLVVHRRGSPDAA